MFVVIPSSLNITENPSVIRIDKIVAIYHQPGTKMTIVSTGANDFITHISTLEVLNLIKEVQISSAIDYILKEEK